MKNSCADIQEMQIIRLSVEGRMAESLTRLGGWREFTPQIDLHSAGEALRGGVQAHTLHQP